MEIHNVKKGEELERKQLNTQITKSHTHTQIQKAQFYSWLNFPF